MDSTTTLGLGTTRTRARPAARRAIWPGPSRVPAQDDLPLEHVLPRRADVLAGLGRRAQLTWTTPPSVCSMGTTASAPRGIGAPVMMRIVWPVASDSVGVAGRDVVDDGQDGRLLARPSRSAACTAYPSIAELVNPGSCPWADVVAGTHPCASSTPRSNGGTGRTVSRIRARCCSTAIIGRSPVRQGLMALRRELVEPRAEVLAELGVHQPSLTTALR